MSKKESVSRILIMLVVSALGFSFLLADKNTDLKAENTKLQQQLQAIQQEKEGFKEGKYTLITNLSSSMYVNRIPKNLEGALPWTDVNGVSGFDIEVGNTHYRYVEGHIEMPQLALYAPEIHLEVVSEKEGP